MKPQEKPCERCGKKNPAEIHTCTPKPQLLGLRTALRELESVGEKYPIEGVKDLLKKEGQRYGDGFNTCRSQMIERIKTLIEKYEESNQKKS